MVSDSNGMYAVLRLIFYSVQLPPLQATTCLLFFSLKYRETSPVVAEVPDLSETMQYERNVLGPRTLSVSFVDAELCHI